MVNRLTVHSLPVCHVVSVQLVAKCTYWGEENTHKVVWVGWAGSLPCLPPLVPWFKAHLGHYVHSIFSPYPTVWIFSGINLWAFPPRSKTETSFLVFSPSGFSSLFWESIASQPEIINEMKWNEMYLRTCLVLGLLAMCSNNCQPFLLVFLALHWHSLCLAKKNQEIL